MITGLAALLAGLVFFAAAPLRADTPTFDNTARFLAGINPEAGSVMEPYAKEAAWQRHARALDQAWARIEKAQLSKIRVWSKKHLPESRDFMLYMFSGPDFLYADAFYPDASTYVLVGLEPVGPIPDLTRMSAGGRAAALNELNASLYTVLQYSFFITKDMKAKLRTGQLVGTIPVLYAFMARAGKTVEDVTLVSLNDDGTVTPSEGSTPKGSAPGVKIVFSDAGAKKTLYYFSTDLSNGGLKASGLLKFCDTLGPADSLIKSASYLLHSGNFTTARDYLLKKSAALIQDDSGIPLRYFDRKTWELHPFGRYAGPISIFSGRYQNDMAQLFNRGKATPIDFGIGYRWRTHETNVLLAKNLELAAAMAAEKAAAEKATAEKAAAEKLAEEKAAAEKAAAEKLAEEQAAAERLAREKEAIEKANAPSEEARPDTPAATPEVTGTTAGEKKPE